MQQCRTRRSTVVEAFRIRPARRQSSTRPSQLLDQSTVSSATEHVITANGTAVARQRERHVAGRRRRLPDRLAGYAASDPAGHSSRDVPLQSRDSARPFAPPCFRRAAGSATGLPTMAFPIGRPTAAPLPVAPPSTPGQRVFFSIVLYERARIDKLAGARAWGNPIVRCSSDRA